LCDDLLFVNGAYAEYIALPARLVARNLVTVPPGVPAARVAFAEPVACCLHAVELAAVEPGDAVAVLGHGPLGLLLGLLARQAGARVVVAGKAGPRLDVARGLGFAACVDVAASPDPVGLVRGAAGGPRRGSRPSGRSTGGAPSSSSAAAPRGPASASTPGGSTTRSCACSGPSTTRRR